jgi:hypothetical protein
MDLRPLDDHWEVAMRFELLLIEEEQEYIPPETAGKWSVYPPPVSNQDRNNVLVSVLDEEARRQGVDIKRETERQEEARSKLRRERHARSGRHEGPAYYGGMPGQEFLNIETLTYACGSLAAFAVFARNVIGAAKDWRDLRDRRKIKARLDGKDVDVHDGADLLALVEKELAASDRIRLPPSAGSDPR